MRKEVCCTFIVALNCLSLSIFGQQATSKDDKDSAVSGGSTIARAMMIDKYKMASSEIADMHGKFRTKPDPNDKFPQWEYQYTEMQRRSPEQSTEFATVAYDLIYTSVDLRGSRNQPGFLIGILIFSTKSKYVEAKEYFASMNTSNGLSPHARQYLSDSYVKHGGDFQFRDCFCDAFYSDADEVIVEIAVPRFQVRFSVVWDRYLRRTGLTSVSKLHRKEASDPVACVQNVIQAAREDDIRTIRNSHVSLTLWESCFRNTILQTLPPGAKPIQERVAGAIELREVLDYGRFVEFVYAVCEQHKGTFTCENLGKKYIPGPDSDDFNVSGGLNQVVGDNYSNVLLMADGKPIVCMIVIKSSDGWKIYQFREVPKELEDTLKHL